MLTPDKSGFYQSSTVPNSSSLVGVVHWTRFPDQSNGFLGVDRNILEERRDGEVNIRRERVVV